ncbi:MAG: hypothetical protein KJO24_02240 [Gammaproteobacteria bacterium]|nr:hypothetical protein [Gammaproteobacteria bacterium]
MKPLNLDNLTHNPVLLAGTALMAGAGLVTLASLAILLAALLYNPDIQFQLNLGGQSTNRVDPQTISQRNFFGLAEAEPSIVVEDLPETKLELVLRGAFAALEPANAGAIIEDKRKVAQHYSIGDNVPGDATLKAIYADRVVLARNGLLETLYFPEEIDSGGIDSRFNTSSSGAGAITEETRQNKERREAIRERIRQLRGRK